MVGKITKFYSNHGIGVIAAENGRRFRFSSSEITNRNGALLGIEVDFLLELGRPTQIVPLVGSPWTAFSN
ncbi:MAG: hypothetical protein AB7O43_08200 [Hyphomicrobiaceae bacterium]